MDGERPWVRGSGRLMDALVTQDNTYRIGWFVIVKRSFHGRLAGYIKMPRRAHLATRVLLVSTDLTLFPYCNLKVLTR